MPRQHFLIRFDLRSIVLTPEVIKWKVIVFLRRWFFINNFCEMCVAKIKMTPLCLSHRAGSECVVSDLDRSISKFNLSSGQVKVRSRSDQDPSGSISTSSEPGRRAKSFVTICASLSPSCRYLLAKNEL